MKFSTEIQEELNGISPLLAGMEKKNIFSVPDGYFNVLSVNIIKTITNLPAHDKNDKLSVPEGYFDNLSSSILGKIRSLREDPSTELRELSPMLYSIQNENVFEVPAGYFRNLEYDILDKIKPQAKVVQLKKRDSIWKYATAAVVTGVIAVSSLMVFNSQSNTDDNIVSTAVTTAHEFKSEQQVNAAIAKLSDDEIIKYLEKTGTDVDNETLATSVNTNELPAATDYLLDEKTLDTYLGTDRKSQN